MYAEPRLAPHFGSRTVRWVPGNDADAQDRAPHAALERARQTRYHQPTSNLSYPPADPRNDQTPADRNPGGLTRNSENSGNRARNHGRGGRFNRDRAPTTLCRLEFGSGVGGSKLGRSPLNSAGFGGGGWARGEILEKAGESCSGGLEPIAPVARSTTAMGDRNDDPVPVDQCGDDGVGDATQNESPNVVLGGDTRDADATAWELGGAGHGASYLGCKQIAVSLALALVPDDGVLMTASSSSAAALASNGSCIRRGRVLVESERQLRHPG